MAMAGAIVGCVALLPHSLTAAEPGDVRQHAEQSFDQLKRHTEKGAGTSAGGTVVAQDKNGVYSSDHYWIGKGQGDLAKGKIVCQRVSELSARTDLAKKIRVMVKEHMVDRVRE